MSNSMPKRSTISNAKAAFRNHGGMMRMSEAIRAGIHRRTLYALRSAGIIDQLGRGLYRLVDAPLLGNPDLVVAAKRIPKGVICLISALAFHDLTTQIPHEVYVALPRNSELPRIDYPPVRLFRFAAAAYAAGVESHKFDGMIVRVYSREKTLADCFKYRNKIGLDTAIEALKRYREQGRFNVGALLANAEECRVANIMRPYLEATL
jgi:predicted transcriptional regulator of viral defense system